MESLFGRVLTIIIIVSILALGMAAVTQAQDPGGSPPPVPPNGPGASSGPGKSFNPATAPAAPAASPAEQREIPIGYEISPTELKALKERVQAEQAPVAPGTVPDPNVNHAVPQPSAPISDTTWEGISYTGWVPPDPQIATGPSDVMVAVNEALRVYDKSGTQLDSSNNLVTWFTNVLSDTNGISIFDPWVLYDQLNDRFILVALAYRSSDNLSQFMISVSKTSSASTGGWCNFAMNGRDNNGSDTSNWADYEKAGITSNAVVLTANMFNASGYFQYSKVRFIPKSLLYDTSCPSLSSWDFWSLQNADGSLAFTIQPAHSYVNSNSTYLINGQSFSGSNLTLWSATTPDGPYSSGSHPSLSRQSTISVDSYAAPPDAEQPGTTTRIDTGDARLLKAVYRDSGLWTTHAVSCSWLGDGGTRSCARWYQINPVANTIVQQGTLGSSGLYYYYPALMPDAAQNAVVVFNRSGAAEYAGVRYTGRQSTDPVNTLQGTAELRAGQGCYNHTFSTRNRWGDYSGVALDPSTGKTWIFGEFAYGSSATCTSNSWRTQVGRVGWSTSQPVMSTTAPITGTTVTPPFDVTGWAIDLGASSGTGVSAVGVYALPQPSGAPISLGLATYGDAHPEVAALYGSQFLNSGFHITVPAGVLSPGGYVMRSYAFSTVAGAWNNWSDVAVTVPSSPTATPTATATPTSTSTPTRTPMPGEAGTIYGHVSLEGRLSPTPDAAYAITLTLSQFPPGTPSPSFVNVASTDYSGYFTATGIVTGTYDVQVKGGHTLSRKFDGLVVASGDNTMDFAGHGVLKEGDANADNYVTILDFSMLRTAFGKCEGVGGYDPRTDFNQDTCTTILDFSLLRANFGQGGE